MRMNRPWRVVAGMILFALAALGTQASPQLSIEMGYDQTYLAGGWTPLTVVASNMPDPKNPKRDREGFAGELQVLVIDRSGQTVAYTSPLDLPFQSIKRVPFSVLLSDSSSPVRLQLIDRRGRLAAAAEAVPGTNGYNPSNQRKQVAAVPTVLLLSDRNEASYFPIWSGQSANLRHGQPGQLPSDYRAYDGVRVIMTRRPLGGQLDERQLQALQTWLELGGQLIVAAPRSQQELAADPWTAERMPAPVASVEPAELEALAPGSGTGQILVAHWGTPTTDTQVLWNSPAGPLGLARSIGEGRIVALAIDPQSLVGNALNTPLGQQAQQLLEGILWGPGREDLRARHFWSTAEIDPQFKGIMLLPNIWVVSLLLFLFVVLVGPVNFMVLKRRRRLELAWVTIPILAILFFAAVYGYGFIAKGGRQHYASAEILHLSAGNPRGLLLWNAIQFSPAREAYRLDAGPTGSILPLLYTYDDPTRAAWFMRQLVLAGPQSGLVQSAPGNPMSTAQARPEGGYQLARGVEQWQMAFYQGERPQQIDGKIDGELTVNGDGDITAWVENRTGAWLEDATLYAGRRPYSMGVMPPRSRLTLVNNVANVTGLDGASSPPPAAAPPVLKDPFYRNAADQIAKGAMESFPLSRQWHTQRRARLVARQSQWLSNVAIDPPPQEAKSVAMVEVSLPVRLAGAVKLTTEDGLRREVTDFGPTDFGNLQDESTDFCRLRADWWMEVLIGLAWPAEGASYRDGRLSIAYRPDGETLKLEVFNFATCGWDMVQVEADASVPIDRSVEVPIAPGWVNPVGHFMKIRLGAQMPQNNTGGNNNGVGIRAIDAEMTFAGKDRGQ